MDNVVGSHVLLGKTYLYPNYVKLSGEFLNYYISLFSLHDCFYIPWAALFSFCDLEIFRQLNLVIFVQIEPTTMSLVNIISLNFKGKFKMRSEKKTTKLVNQ